MNTPDSSPSRRLIPLILVLVLTLGHLRSVLAQQSAPAWRINPSASSLSFSTTKAGSAGVGGITEVMRFRSFKGGLDTQGRIHLDIELKSVDSGIALRDERLQTMLWNVSSQPAVHFSAQIQPEVWRTLQQGHASMTIALDGVLTMAGKSKSVQSQLTVALVGDKLLVSTRYPIIVNANDFDLQGGVEALRAIMGLNFIATSAPVTFQLELVRASGHASPAGPGLAPPTR